MWIRYSWSVWWWCLSGSSRLDSIEYVTLQSEGNGIDFGDLTQGMGHSSSCSSSTRGLFGGGYQPSLNNTINYVEIQTLETHLILVIYFEQLDMVHQEHLQQEVYSVVDHIILRMIWHLNILNSLLLHQREMEQILVV